MMIVHKACSQIISEVTSRSTTTFLNSCQLVIKLLVFYLKIWTIMIILVTFGQPIMISKDSVSHEQLRYDCFNPQNLYSFLHNCLDSIFFNFILLNCNIHSLAAKSNKADLIHYQCVLILV